MSHKRRKCLSELILLVLLTIPAQALALMVGLSTQDLVRMSDTVVTGRVEKVESFWSADGETILTQARIAVDEAVKGDVSSREITVEYPGGEVDGIALEVSDTAPLVEGERVLLFLKASESGNISSESLASNFKPVFNIAGRAQGKYTIDHNGIASKSGFSLANGHELVEREIPLSELIAKIRKGE